MRERMADLRAQFHDRADAYSRSDWHVEYAVGLIDALALRPDDTVLDAGAGTGMSTRAIARHRGRS